MNDIVITGDDAHGISEVQLYLQSFKQRT